MLNKVYALAIAFVLGFASAAGAQGTIQEAAPVLLPPVTVSCGLPPGCAATRPTVVLERADLAALPAHDLAEALRFLPGVTLESRGPGPVTGDLSLRGSTFSQVLVLIDGVRLADPQTAHHNLDLPLLLEDVERIEVLEGPACARYGADAVAGVINIITRTPRANFARLEGAGGSFATTRAAAAAGGATDSFAGFLSASREASAGYRFDTDFEVGTLAGKLAAGAEGGPGGELFFGLQDKDFGAFDFYSPGRGFASREQTGTRLVTAALHSAPRDGYLEARAYFREHEDDFRLDFQRPSLSGSHHRTRLAGLQLYGQWEGRGLLSAGLDVRGETIESTSLGDHERGVASPFAEYALGLGPLSVDAAVRLDAYSRFGPQGSPSLGLLWRLGPQLAARAQAATAYRVPSYTELYYRDLANQGSASLKPERSLSWGAGLVATPAALPLEASLDYFERRERGIIDWVRGSTSAPWQAVNSGRVEVRGLEAKLDWGARWGRAIIDYVLAEKDLKSEAAFSKYVLTNPRHQLTASLWRRGLPLGLDLFGQLTWRSFESQDYTLLDLTLSRRFGPYELFAEGHNLFDAHYTEDLVGRPGVWGLGGVRIRL